MTEKISNQVPGGKGSSKPPMEPAERPPKRRLIICYDGTWMDAVSNRGPLSNIARLARCIESVADDYTEQIVYYRTGIGCGTSILSRLIDGATGRGISINIRDAYNFICQNYDKEGKTDLYLLGFSRGAFTVSCLAKFIEDVGLLPRVALRHLKPLFEGWKRDMRTAEPGNGSESPASIHKVINSLSPDEQPERDIKIKAVGIWDTVSALGIPIPFQFPQPMGKKFRAIHTSIPNNVEYCFHALALDERRKHFYPILWYGDSCPFNMTQCWFVGEHGDVGGGNHDNKNKELDIWRSNLPLVWMIANLQGLGLRFNSGTITKLLNASERTKGKGPLDPVNLAPTPAADCSYAILTPAETKIGGADDDMTLKKFFDETPSRKSRDIKDYATDLAYGLMGFRKRRPGERKACGERIHWSVREVMKNGYRKSPLRKHVMYRDKKGNLWVRPEELKDLVPPLPEDPDGFPIPKGIREAEISDNEMRLIREWYPIQHQETEKKSNVSCSADTYPVSEISPVAARMQFQKQVEETDTLYCAPDQKHFMEALEGSMFSKQRYQL